MPKKIEEGSRAQVAACLPEAIARAVGFYELFLENEVPSDPKDFKSYQEACKAAITHVESLIKLAQWVDVPESSNDQIILAAMLENAKQELERHHDNKEQEDDA